MPARTALFSRKASGGVYTIADIVKQPGSVFFVHSGTGADATTGGFSPDAPLATLDYAIGLCTANKGDVIYLLPGHAESVAAAIGIDIDVAGIRIIGLGHGSDRATFTGTTAATTTIEINAANVWLENLLFVADFTNGITEFIDVKTTSNDLMFKNCAWRETVNTKEFLKCVTIEATIARVTFDGCDFSGTVGGDSLTTIFTEGACSYLRVINCSFNGDYLDGVMDLNATLILQPEFGNLMIRNMDPTNGFAIRVASTTIGSFWNIHALTQKANTVPIDDVSASFLSNCIGTDVAATSGLVFPATATAWS